MKRADVNHNTKKCSAELQPRVSQWYTPEAENPSN